MTRVQANLNDGIGLTKPGPDDRDPDHEDPQWFERDLDGDDYKGTDEPDVDLFPTERHWRIVPKS